MKYILLVHHNEEVLGSLSKTDLQQMREDQYDATDINERALSGRRALQQFDAG